MCFGVVDITVEGADLCWEKMGIGLDEECLFLLPPGVFVLLSIATRTDAALVLPAFEL